MGVTMFLVVDKVGIYARRQSWRAGLRLCVRAPSLRSVCYTTGSISGGRRRIALIVGVTIFLIVVQSR